MLNNPWSYPTPPTPTPFTTWTTSPPSDLAMPIREHSRPFMHVPHLPVLTVTRTRPPPQDPNSPPPKKWKFRLRMSLSFRCHLSLPRIPPPSKWRSKQPRPTPIIPVDPHYDLMKTPLTTPPVPESPPSYNLQTYEPPRRDPTRMWAAKTGSCSTPCDTSSALPTRGHEPKASPPPNLTLTRTMTRTPTRMPTQTSGRMTVRNLGPVPRQPPPTPPTIRAPQNGTCAATTLEWDGR